MTLVVGVLARDGVVLASDSLASGADSSGVPISSMPALKVCTSGKLLWAASGSGMIIDEIERRISEAWVQSLFRPEEELQIQRKCQQLISKVHTDLTSSWNPMAPIDMQRGKPSATVLFATVLAGQPRLLLVEPNTESNWIKPANGHLAIGSGAPYGMSILWRHTGKTDARSLRAAAMTAYRAVDDACDVAPGNAMIRKPVQLGSIGVEDGGARLWTEADLAELLSSVNEWRVGEWDYFANFSADTTSAEAVDDGIPAMEQASGTETADGGVGG